MQYYEQLLRNNRRWVEQKTRDNPAFFAELSLHLTVEPAVTENDHAVLELRDEDEQAGPIAGVVQTVGGEVLERFVAYGFVGTFLRQ